MPSAPAQNARRASTSTDAQIDIPNLTGTLLPFQKAGVAFLEMNGGDAIIGDEMGLGKTIQAIAYLALHPELRPALIVVPASLKPNWRREIDKWLTVKKETHIINGKTPLALPNADIYIINYDLVGSWQRPLRVSRLS